MSSMAVALAVQWHEARQSEDGHDDSPCWCCCITCFDRNPHYDAAQIELGDRC